MAVIWSYARQAKLMDPGMTAPVHRRVFSARMAVPVVFLLSVPAAFLLNAYTPLLWLVLLPASRLSRWLSARSEARSQPSSQGDG